MTHLTVEEIIDFVSFDELTDEKIALAKKVNEHIRSCRTCFEKVSAFQLVYDELQRIGTVRDARQSLYRMIDQRLLDEIRENEVKKAIAYLDDFDREVIR